MPATAQEQFGRRLADDSAEIVYLVFGASNAAEAKLAVATEAPATYETLPRSDTQIEELRDLEGIYQGSALYTKSSAGGATSGPSFRFETRGGSQHITQSLATTRYGDGAAPTGGAIGATADAVEGTEITVPIYTFSETHTFGNAAVTTAFKSTIFSLTGTVNNGSFRGLDAGECLFLGAAGQQLGDGDWSIDFAFAGSPNLTGLGVGDITGIAKQGWDYLWVRYQTAEDATAKLLVRKPIGVYVEQVYRRANFGALNLPSV
jgi:hypothetical protein